MQADCKNSRGHLPRAPHLLRHKGEPLAAIGVERDTVRDSGESGISKGAQGVVIEGVVWREEEGSQQIMFVHQVAPPRKPVSLLPIGVSGELRPVCCRAVRGSQDGRARLWNEQVLISVLCHVDRLLVSERAKDLPESRVCGVAIKFWISVVRDDAEQGPHSVSSQEIERGPETVPVHRRCDVIKSKDVSWTVHRLLRVNGMSNFPSRVVGTKPLYSTSGAPPNSSLKRAIAFFSGSESSFGMPPRS